MTENKRYSFYKENDYVTFFDYSEGMNYGDVVNHLNSYADEVKAYSKQNRKLIILKNNLIEDNQRLEKENKHLKQFKDSIFCLIDKNIKEVKELFEEDRIDLNSYNSAMITLIGLKEELKGDVE